MRGNIDTARDNSWNQGCRIATKSQTQTKKGVRRHPSVQEDLIIFTLDRASLHRVYNKYSESIKILTPQSIARVRTPEKRKSTTEADNSFYATPCALDRSIKTCLPSSDNETESEGRNHAHTDRYVVGKSTRGLAQGSRRCRTSRVGRGRATRRS